MADEWNPEDDEEWRKHPDPWRNFLDAAERINLPSQQPVVRSAAGSSVIPRSRALVPFKDPTKFNIKLPDKGPSGELRRQLERRWGGRPSGGGPGIGNFLRMYGAKSPIGRLGQGIVGLWKQLPPHHKKALMEFMGQPVSELRPLDAIQDTDIYRKIMELVTPESEKPMEGGNLLPHYPKYQPRLEKFITNLPQRVWSNPEQLRGVFENAMKKGLISRDELYYEGGAGKNTWGRLPIEHRSLGNFLDNLSSLSKGEHTSLVTSPAKQARFLKQITKQDLLDVVRRNPLDIAELELSQAQAEKDHSLSLRYPPGGRNQWTLQGGHDYRETLLNLSDIKDDETRNLVSDLLHTSGRAPLKNNLGWLRHHKRMLFGPNATGRDTTHGDEFQTDVRFHEGFPLKDKFMEIAMQRLFRQAAEDGTDFVSWTPGEEHAERSMQRHYINNVLAKKIESGGQSKQERFLLGRNEEPWADNTDWPIWRVQGQHHDDMEFPSADYKDSELDKAFGKEFADKIRREHGTGSITAPYDESDPMTADGLRTDKSLGVATVYTPGGLKKMELYNKKLVNIANKLGKKFNTKVEWKNGVLLPGISDQLKVPSIKITPELRKFYSTAPIKLAQGGLVDKPLYEDSGTRYG
jgi:hypothetical protein